jgi:hypothetical protein
MYLNDVTDSDTVTDAEPTLTDAQLEIATRAAGDYEPIPVSADDAAPADGKAPQLVGRDKYMADTKAGKFMRQAEAEGTSTDGTEPPTVTGRAAHMARVARGEFLGGGK